MIKLLIFGLMFYVIFFLLNYGILLAYYQRAKPGLSLKKYSTHRRTAIILSLPSIFATFGVQSVSMFPRYGIKYWPGEKPLTIFKSENKYYEMFLKLTDPCDSPEGKCKDFWD